MDDGARGGDSSGDLARLAEAITRLEAVVAAWDESQRLVVGALKGAIEDLNKEALRRIIRTLKDDPAAGAKLREAVTDPLVYGVLDFHGLLKAPLQSRIEAALDEVRPFMATHGGNVELVAVKPPDTVEIRLIGNCHGCPASSQTLTEGVEKAIRAHAPEIVHINQVSRGKPEAAGAMPAAGTNGEATLHFVSPFARHAQSGWIDACDAGELVEGGIFECTVKDRSVLLYRKGGHLSCVENRCAHLGMPLEMGRLEDGVLTCPYHGFQYALETGECLTAPEVQLKVHAVRLQGARVQVRIEL